MHIRILDNCFICAKKKTLIRQCYLVGYNRKGRGEHHQKLSIFEPKGKRQGLEHISNIVYFSKKTNKTISIYILRFKTKQRFNAAKI